MASHHDKPARSLFTGVLATSGLLLALGCSSSDTAKGSKTSPTGTPDASGLGGAASITDAGGNGTPLREPVLPEAASACPVLQTGTVNVLGKDTQMWVGEKRTDVKGPVLFYWHGTGSVAAEIEAFMAPMLTEIQSEGGIAVSFTSTLGTGTNTGNFVWYTGDYDSADLILACAVQQLNIDVHQIYAAGCSAGGLEAGAMAVMRSSYLAGAMTNSGGSLLSTFEDPTHIPALITTHGTYAADFVILHFADVSKATDQAFADLGGYAVDCDHGGGHCGAPQDDIAAQWQFLKDHPFGITKDPYADGLPSSFPSYCTKILPQHDQ